MMPLLTLVIVTTVMAVLCPIFAMVEYNLRVYGRVDTTGGDDMAGACFVTFLYTLARGVIGWGLATLCFAGGIGLPLYIYLGLSIAESFIFLDILSYLVFGVPIWGGSNFGRYPPPVQEPPSRTMARALSSPELLAQAQRAMVNPMVNPGVGADWEMRTQTTVLSAPPEQPASKPSSKKAKEAVKIDLGDDKPRNIVRD